MGARVHPLKDNQRLAAAPRECVWLSASAGTGKTQVLSARVLRLLLEPDTSPEEILCLTFTKAGAAEMANRVNEVLALWVRMPAEQLASDLDAIGAAPTPQNIARARTLFASVLDCPGGGLRIDTLHAFAQWLLGAFPHEAGLVAGTRAMEDRDRELLGRRVLAELLEEWDAQDPGAIAALEDLSRTLDPEAVRTWLMRCAQARAIWFGPGAWQPPMRARVARLLGLPADFSATALAAMASDRAFPLAGLDRLRAAYRAWGTPTAKAALAALDAWVAGDPAARLAGREELHRHLFTRAQGVKNLASLSKHDPGIGAAAEEIQARLQEIEEQACLLELSEFLSRALELGRRFALAWDAAKMREGLMDFDDLIARAAALLNDSAAGDWIRYKLDRRFNHILVDEAQDTNEAQWAIIDALADDFFSGAGAAGDTLRTLFVVGDYKQAIFGFQGTSPRNFAQKRQFYAHRLAERAANARSLRQNIVPGELLSLGLGRSYRTAQSVLGFVDAAIEAIGHQAFGLDQPPPPHVGDQRPGLVTLWHPVAARPEDEAPPGEEPAEAAEPGDRADDPAAAAFSAPERRMADAIAAQIKAWWDGGFALAKGGARNARPGDIMVLVRKRRELAGLIVARLHAAGVPVAGVDRLQLGTPLAVQDLLAALRFAVQPGDDLSLASLLVSPLLGWSHEDLLAHGFRPDGVELWAHLRGGSHPLVIEAVEKLRALLARADFEAPQALLHWLLVGPWRGRARLLARLGGEAADPIDELLSAALKFSASHTGSLVGFLHWFDAANNEVKREAEGAGDLVRVLTVHGSKGLQAPIVILADACGNPDQGHPAGLELAEDLPGAPGPKVPLIPIRKSQQFGRLARAASEAAAAEREEHWRLLYVAMTRAEEALFIGGALGLREQEPAAGSWYAGLAPLFATAKPCADPIWGMRHELGERAPPVPHRTQVPLPIPPVLPAWATSPIGQEPRPPRPLAPSYAGAEDDSPDPPLPVAEAREAARRGVLIHALLERLPDAPPAMREGAGRAWLLRHGADLPAAEREAMLASALLVLAEPGWEALFGPEALAEVPLAAIVADEVISGKVDRLLVEEDRVMVVDFKTARRPPRSLAAIPRATLRQMAAYVAALEVIYPGRLVEAAVLYTQLPQLYVLPAEWLGPCKPGLPGGQ